MRNINLLGNGKKKTNSFIISKTPESSLFFYFIQKWCFFERVILSFLEDSISFNAYNITYSKYSNEYIVNNSINKKITSHLILKKDLKRKIAPSTKAKMVIKL